mmetsp:Transcript_127026/g.320962  ORF Transcript_127026/g.320962 Transcript_127026/m.320962 type:complete len:236 (-) Transcript_127026:911-1618(-)
MVGQPGVLQGVCLVPQHAKDVEAAQDRIREVDVLREGALRVVSSLCWVGHSHHSTASLQRRHNAGFGDGDCLLLHGLVEGGSIVVVHLVKLVDEAHAVIGKDHSTALQAPLPVLIPGHRRSETHRAGALPGRVHRARECLLDVFEELRLREAGVTHDEGVDVAADTVLPGCDLLLATHHAQRDCRLHVPHAIDRGCHRGDEAFADVRVLGELEDLLLFVVCNLNELDVTPSVKMH